ncbi:hypothetical protein [Myxococcus sp. RHSTA-1-4]|uniref:hypothetical protein n=1 Tax=Myxococcus sp. RHSTA-1-4 TaxID=2874601 RepID=UPI001CBC915B|nr:hypothetical protein [Myxococcus sp. RHSTA-1-4]MBZ4418381.1 hypothetical protein [Myxococcus sp. RHSTA-1-4]
MPSFNLSRLSCLCPTLLLASVLLAQPSRAATPLEDNRRITEGYIQLAYEMGAVLDPELEPGGISSVRPNWYVFAPHASRTGGEGMLGTAIARSVIDAARGRTTFSVLQALERVGLTGQALVSGEQLGLELVLQGLPFDAAASLGSLTSSLNAEALADPRTLLTTASRLASLYWSAPAFFPLDKAERVVVTLERTLHEGNLAIFTDVGAAGRLYLDWRQGAGAVTPERVLTEFVLPGASAAEARQAYDFALAHAYDSPRPYELDLLLPGMNWKSLLVAAFAVYEEARLAPTPAARDALIAMGNNYVAWREQHDMAQPVFMPASRAPDEVSRPKLLQAITPLLRTRFGTMEWNYADYAYGQPDRDGNPFTSPPTEYNWAVFWDRWTGILHAFDQAYLQPTALWAMPDPVVDPAALTAGD